MPNLFKKKFMKVPSTSFSVMFREIGRNAFVDWLIILIINIVLTTLVILFGFYLYWQISTGNYTTQETVSGTNNKIFNEKDLDTIIDRFKGKQDNSTQAKSGYRGVSDPSL